MYDYDTQKFTFTQVYINSTYIWTFLSEYFDAHGKAHLRISHKNLKIYLNFDDNIL